MKRVILVGAGQIGSRHLQALKAVKIPLLISVVDPFPASLTVARERFEEAEPKEHPHTISFVSEIPKTGGTIDLAIVATRSDMRRAAIEQILEKNSCNFFLLEKLLFQKPEDYEAIEKLFEITGSKAWVNCTMRTVPIYKDVKEGTPQKVNYNALTGSAGLVTNVVHFLDHMAYLSDCLDFTVDTSLINPTPIESKRKGFVEFSGTIRVTFANGSFGSFTQYPSGTGNYVVSVSSEDSHWIIREAEEKAWVSKKSDDWKWAEVPAPIPFQSVMTTWLVEEILSTGTCRAVSYADSAKIHLQILEPLRQFLNNHGGNYDYFPFT